MSSGQRAATSREQSLTAEADLAEQNLVETRKLIGGNTATLERELAAREEEEKQVTNQMQERMKKELEQQITAMQKQTALMLTQLEHKQRGTVRMCVYLHAHALS